MFLNSLSSTLNDNPHSDAPELNGRKISHMLWADDVCLMSKSVEGLQSQLNCLGEFCNFWGIKINLQKTKIVVCKRGGRLAAQESWSLLGSAVEVVPAVKYLGVIMANSHSYAKHRLSAISKAMRALFTLTKFYFGNKNLPVKILIRLFKSLVEPVLLYGSEIWAILYRKSRFMKDEISLNWDTELDKPAMRFLKRIMGLPRGASNSALLLDLGLTRCQTAAFTRAVSYWCRLTRKPDNSIMRDCLSHQIDMMSAGKKPWLFFIKQLLNHSGLGFYFERDPLSF